MSLTEDSFYFTLGNGAYSPNLLPPGWPTAAERLRSVLSQHSAWVAGVLGDADRVVINQQFLEQPLLPLLAARASDLPEHLYLDHWNPETKTIASDLLRAITRVEKHPESVAASWISSAYVKGKFKGLHWGSVGESSTLFAFWFGDIPVLCVAFDLVESPSADDPRLHAFLVIRKQDVLRFNDVMVDILRPKGRGRKPTLFTYHGGRAVTDEPIQPMHFDSLVLDEKVIDLVWKDIQAFRERRKWFVKNNLPYRRGYLFHGAPGNGKTSLIKAILTHYKMDAHAINLTSPNIGDQSLSTLYKNAASGRESVIIFEDLDRAFPKTGERKVNVTMQGLLNAMDGVSTSSGVIVIATANEPTALDKAILQRPGRFDRVVLFPNPDAPLREKYFAAKMPLMTPDALGSVASHTSGFSFAQLQECYILGGQKAYERGTEEMTVDDLITAAKVLQVSNKQVGKEATKSGFSVSLGDDSGY